MKKLFSKRSIKIILVVILICILSVAAYFIFKPCEHQWVTATCNSPKICSLCSETEGTKLEHQWADATCDTAVTCNLCGEVAGNPIGHKWQDATCTEAKKCSVCDKTKGKALGHTWEDATYTKPKTCTICGKTSGSALEKPSNNGGSSNNSNGNSSLSNGSTDDYAKCLICGNRTSRSQTNYCSSHDCMISTCPYPAKNSSSSGWGAYCDIHGCYYSGCTSYPIGGTNYCGAHRPED